jgi:hypothetical protein
MPGPSDPRTNPEVNALLRSLPGLKHPPFAHAADLRETALVLKALPELAFPINSAGELIQKIEASGKPVEIVGITVDPAVLVQHMPPHYFPIASLENFAEKIADLIRKSRIQVDVTKEFKNLKAQIPALKYPISDAQNLVAQLGADKPYKYQGGAIKPRDIAHRIPTDIFPITSEKDFEVKMSYLMVNRPLIVGHRQ